MPPFQADPRIEASGQALERVLLEKTFGEKCIELVFAEIHLPVFFIQNAVQKPAAQFAVDNVRQVFPFLASGNSQRL